MVPELYGSFVSDRESIVFFNFSVSTSPNPIRTFEDLLGFLGQGWETRRGGYCSQEPRRNKDGHDEEILFLLNGFLYQCLVKKFCYNNGGWLFTQQRRNLKLVFTRTLVRRSQSQSRNKDWLRHYHYRECYICYCDRFRQRVTNNCQSDQLVTAPAAKSGRF